MGGRGHSSQTNGRARVENRQGQSRKLAMIVSLSWSASSIKYEREHF
jgi:hypothetical protein